MSLNPSGDVPHSSSTAVARDADPPPNHDPSNDLTGRTSPPSEPTAPATGEEQALESHEVIELQTFSERKAWIEQKIKLLEKMPPIEVFVGLDAVHASAEHVPGLPTREELKQWVAEHDAIEKETEIFDRGELTKLRQLTKAATQRNLSPADTDVIELTLTTIYELDKLLHLLRDRSELLELLSVRLTWEESRIAAWVDRRKILEDLGTFLETRARWNPSVYDTAVRPEEPQDPKRRMSVTSLASNASDSSMSSAGFSRGIRFKLAELLSRDAAQFAGRVTSLRHGKVTVAGKVLDKLIDNSRKPVPEVLLDEQDKLEEKGISEMEHLGKFVMSIVMQWRKADEIYVETMKDKVASQNLMEEIETAKLHQPTARQSASFVSRADALLKRLALRGNPTSSSSTFPCPEHPLFSDQQEVNKTLAESLSEEIISASNIARKVDSLAKAYRVSYEAVKRVEDLATMANSLSTMLSSVISRVQNGVSVGDGDGSPLDLTSEACLEPSCHSTFLALFPSILQEFSQATGSSNRVLRSSQLALLGLDHPGINGDFKANAVSQFQRLQTLLDDAQRVCFTMKAKSDQLRESRRIWTLMDRYQERLENLRHQVVEAMEKQRWRPVSGHAVKLSTPESPPTSPLPPDISSTEVSGELLQLSSHLSRDIDAPLSLLSTSLETPLMEWLLQNSIALKGSLDTVSAMTLLLDSIQRQADAMKTTRDDFNDFQLRIEDTKVRIESRTSEMLAGMIVNGDIVGAEAELQVALKAAQDGILGFVNSLADRIPFVQRSLHSDLANGLSGKKRLASTGAKSAMQPIPGDLPFDLATLDDAVRADSNSFVMILNGKLEGLSQAVAHFRVAGMAKDVDSLLMTTVTDINAVTQELSALKSSLAAIISQGSDILIPLEVFAANMDEVLQTHRRRISRSFSPIREILRNIDSAPGAHDAAVHEIIYAARCRAVDDAEIRFNTWNSEASTFKDKVLHAQRTEAARLEQIRVAEDQRQLAEKERIAAEEAEARRIEKEQLAEEEKRRLEEERRLEEVRQLVEIERIAAEEAERERVERERAETEERQRLDEERLAEEKRRQAEKDRIAAEEAEKARLLQEKLEMEEKLRLVEEELAEERSLQAEKDRIAAEKLCQQTMLAEERRLEAERLAAEQLERQRLEHQLTEARQLEDARLAAEQLEQERLEQRLMEEARLEEEVRIAAELNKHMMQERRLQEEAEVARRHRDAEERVRAEEARQRYAMAAEQEHSVAEEIQNKRAGKVHQREIEERQKQKKSPSKEQAKKLTVKDLDDEDVFGIRLAPSESYSQTKEMKDLQAQILAFRKRLRSISINEISRPMKSSTRLPDLDQWKKMTREFSSISSGVALLPASAEDPSVDVELRSLRSEIEASAKLMTRVEKLAQLADDIRVCDAALSDLLEHIDSYPASPKGPLSSSYQPLLDAQPEDQLSSRLAFTRRTIESMTSKFATVSNDSRAIAEKSRILQTWSELEDMGNDKLGGKKSRPASVMSSRHSSGRNSSASIVNARSAKKGAYSSLSVASGPSQKRLLVPQQSTPRRAVSGSAESHSRPPSQLPNMSSSRSTSGPLGFSVYGSTFASRQRTASLSNSASTPTRHPSGTPARSRAQTAQVPRASSPTGSEASSYSHSVRAHSRSSTSMSTWSRAPRNSLSSLVPMGRRDSTPHKKPSPKRKTYVADPKNKLDVAVGDVVNRLPIGINIEGVSETWKDQSGKYWIGNQDPRLCFCRILRSQTVMVRVGGGWSELSKFIKDHFADSFRLMPDSPPRPGAPEEKWISSATLLEAPEFETPPLPPGPPRTPEPTMPFVPSFSLSTPSGQSPRSVKSNSPSTKGSPLTAIQFIRRADVDAMLRPVTPSKPPTLRTRTPTAYTNTPARNSVWRP
ncbi:hypothetical protein Hypma_009619 [Hypsizygus marmoreus]|uniref:GAR domain-containing protein n=1 Tax=Hypsizygus marmoreus TaxID=39966 RepID=A0A369JS48_HYPMA|nr:hypothetical protein Hypma_009619 [Hypsizygus marmoreus]